MRGRCVIKGACSKKNDREMHGNEFGRLRMIEITSGVLDEHTYACDNNRIL